MGRVTAQQEGAAVAVSEAGAKMEGCSRGHVEPGPPAAPSLGLQSQAEKHLSYLTASEFFRSTGREEVINKTNTKPFDYRV